ncbi:MAG TPA: ATP-dependent protease ATPase subunit HslU [Thermoanaerobaculia bacterium]|nr:ATP-dependent protease ATPase subunit HslU [Thermoanaerobaculia bacterium]HUM30812.1 ATP-dependent protease ATPase subunit HslU [Thermoanaerobaculia bacterium]HXK69147.1 ATP-dependent protease ATPase subunit HslU [Thermoanaerobaculia bacterium]
MEPEHLTPKEIVSILDQYIIGQRDAKRAVAIALRNRWRRQQLPEESAEEILPKNIIMIGPTGVGKTEIARRLARISDAPFIKVEASKFTEVGYVGRDVESIVRDLVDEAIKIIKEREIRNVRERAKTEVVRQMLPRLVPGMDEESFSRMLWNGDFDDRDIEVEVEEKQFPKMEIFTPQGIQDMDLQVQDMFSGLFGGKKRRKTLRVAEARNLLLEQKENALVDMGSVAQSAISLAEQSGIVFVDEIDKIAGRSMGQGPDVSREGVQRDLLPIVEGTVVRTRYGMVRTDHILFVAAGAFHVARPSDLIPELQGRFPIRVELKSLSKEDFIRILTEPKHALIKQYKALLETEGVQLSFSDCAISAIAALSEQVNDKTENIGARRLHTILERLLEEVSFHAPDMQGVSVTIDENYVHDHLKDIVQDSDLSRYML